MKTLDYPIRVPTDMLEALGEFTGNSWSDSLALEPFICEAIRNYLRPAPATQTQPAQSAGAGYQWKQLFLPDGTRLRASFDGHSYFAQVDGDAIKYGEHSMSLSRFANLQGSGNRNAWKAIWLRLPGSDEWLLADILRSVRMAAIARLLGCSAQSEPAPQKRERRVKERRTAGHTTKRERTNGVRQPSLGKSGLRPSGPRQSEPGTPGAPVALVAMRINGSQRKNGPSQGSRRKRRAKFYLPEYS